MLDSKELLEIRNVQGEEIIRITPLGDIYWKGRKVETDEDFKGSMLEIGRQLITLMTPK